jgi:hypothetical protein
MGRRNNRNKIRAGFIAKLLAAILAPPGGKMKKPPPGVDGGLEEVQTPPDARGFRVALLGA